MSYATSNLTRKAQLVSLRVSKMVPTTFAYCALVLLGAFFGAETSDTTIVGNVVGLSLAIAAMALVVWGQWFINDVYDKETDKHSNGHRETARGDITERESLVVGWLLVGLGVAATVPLGWYAVGATLAYIAVNTAYSIPPLRTKRGALSSVLTLGTMGAFSVLLGGAAVTTGLNRTLVALALSILVVMTITMSYKDLKDAEHDAKSGVQNFAVRYGAERVRRALLVLLPLVYLAQPALFEMWAALPLFAVFSAIAFYYLYTWDGADDIVFKLDALNGLYLVALGAVYYLL